MSKKHFIKLADYIREHNKNASLGAPLLTFSQDQLRMLAQFCYVQNPNFNTDLWFAYIKGEQGPSGGQI